MKEWMGPGMEVGSMERQVLGPGGRGTGSRSQASGLRTRNPPTPCEGGLAAPPGAPRSSAEVSGALASCLFAEAESWGWRREVAGGQLRGRGAGGKQTAARAAPLPRPPSPGPPSHRWGRSARVRWSPAPGSGRPRPSPRSGAARRRPGAGARPPCRRPPGSLRRRHRRGRLFAGLLRRARGTWARARAAQGHVCVGTLPDGSGSNDQGSRQDAAPQAPSPGRGGAGPAPAFTPLPAALGARRPAPAAPWGTEARPPAAHSAEERIEAAGEQRTELGGAEFLCLGPCPQSLGRPQGSRAWAGCGARVSELRSFEPSRVPGRLQNGGVYRGASYPQLEFCRPCVRGNPEACE